ncbi:MAG: hypothetical protein IJZ91_03115 [Oscillospiraceae bacterium]|nr:hypothetical protein [Oscillospiraceae bacterium]
MDRIKNLNHYQKALLLIMLVMTLIFAPIYHKTVSKVGYEYNDVILMQSVENGNTVYSGKIKGEWIAWFVAVLVCIFNGVSILYADELFRWNLAFQIRNVDKAEPSDWEIAGRYIGWTLVTVMALVIFIMGLQ